MPSLPPKSQQILRANAALIHGVVMACSNRDLVPQLEPILQMSEANGWTALVAAIRRILDGYRDLDLLRELDDEDAVIVESILRGLQNPATLPDPNSAPDPEYAAPGLAAMIVAADTGDVETLRALANMAEQMTRAGGDMARLGAVLARILHGERNPEVLTSGMSPAGEQLVRAILEELGRPH